LVSQSAEEPASIGEVVELVVTVSDPEGVTGGVEGPEAAVHATASTRPLEGAIALVRTRRADITLIAPRHHQQIRNTM
jgi:hypothetical protein